MRDLINAGDRREDPPALRESMRRDGYVYLRGLLSRSDVEEVRCALLNAIAAHHWLAEGSDPLEARPGPVERIENTDPYWEGAHAVQSLECFHRLAHDKRLVETMEVLMGEEALVHPRKIPRIIWPNNDDGITPPHQDFTHVGGTVDFFTCWIPLSDCPVRQGGLCVLPGSQEGGVRPMEQASGAGATRSLVDSEERDWATIGYEAGDVLIFHSMTVHASMANRTDRLRLSMDCRYQPVSEPITRWSLGPFFYKGIMRQHGRSIEKLPPWSEFAVGWSTTEWVETPDRTVVIDAGSMSPAAAHAGSREGRSRFVDTSAFAGQLRNARPTATVWSVAGRPRVRDGRPGVKPGLGADR